MCSSFIVVVVLRSRSKFEGDIKLMKKWRKSKEKDYQGIDSCRQYLSLNIRYSSRAPAAPSPSCSKSCVTTAIFIKETSTHWERVCSSASEKDGSLLYVKQDLYHILVEEVIINLYGDRLWNFWICISLITFTIKICRVNSPAGFSISTIDTLASALFISNIIKVVKSKYKKQNI